MTELLLAAALILAPALASAQPGPQPSITCPSGSFPISPGDDPAFLIGAHLPGVSFCLKAGLYAPTRPIYMEAGDILTGEYGAIIDGANVVQDWDKPATSIISGWNCPQDCSNVTVRNVTIRNLAAYQCIGITGANGWTIDHNRIEGCEFGVTANLSSGHLVEANIISGPCPVNGYRHTQSSWLYNDISGTSRHDCKFGDDWLQGGTVPDLGYVTAVRIIGNRYHDLGPNVAAIWLDTLGAGNVIADNEIDGASDWPAIDVEGTLGTEVARNRVTVGPRGVGLWIAVSRNTDAHHNTVTAPVGGGARTFYDGQFPYFPTANNSIRDSVFIGPSSEWQQCAVISEAECAVYMAANRNTFERNTYTSEPPQEEAPQPPPPADTLQPSVSLAVQRMGRSGNYTAITSASDDVGVVRFELRIDGELRATAPGSLPFTLRARGVHLVTAQAWDLAGNTSAVARVQVTR